VLTRFRGEGGRRRLIKALLPQLIVLGDVAAAEAIADNCELLDLPADTVFIKQDAWESDVFLILSGSVGVEVNGVQVATRPAGTHVGEMAAIDPTEARSATIRTLEPAVVAKLSELQLTKLAASHPELWRRFAVAAAETEKALRAFASAAKSRSGAAHKASAEIPAPRPLQVFLCHSSGDKPAVRELWERLRIEVGIKPWLDEEDLLPGQDWGREIPKAVKASDVVIVCLSRSATSKAGYVQKEIGYALDVAEEQPDGTIFLIPLKLEECDVPERLRRWHWVDAHKPAGYERLMRALRRRASTVVP
jgi:CRP-like cAMP-binding protein